MSTKEKIVEYLRSKGSWVSGTELEAQEWGTKSSVISRRARELVRDGRIERELSSKKTVQYRVGAVWSAQRANKFLQSMEQAQKELF